jgi:hypothetical protein
MFRSVGVARPSANPMERHAVATLAWAVAVGFSIIPLAIVLGLLR